MMEIWIYYVKWIMMEKITEMVILVRWISLGMMDMNGLYDNVGDV